MVKIPCCSVDCKLLTLLFKKTITTSLHLTKITVSLTHLSLHLKTNKTNKYASQKIHQGRLIGYSGLNHS